MVRRKRASLFGPYDPYIDEESVVTHKDSRMRDIFCLADKAYPNVSVRIQPLPNKSDTDIYQLHIRIRRPLAHSDYEWKLECEGTLDKIERLLHAKID